MYARETHPTATSTKTGFEPSQVMTIPNGKIRIRKTRRNSRQLGGDGGRFT
jgi:hypothetical protein